MEQEEVGSDENEEEQNDETNDDYCIFCREIRIHSTESLQKCSECDFESICGEEYNKHWREAPGHIFSLEELRDMGYNV